MHWCPGCHSVHLLYVDSPNRNQDTWKYREDENGPTFYPGNTILRQVYKEDTPPKGKMKSTPVYEWKINCSYVINNGTIAFDENSDHSLAGATVELPSLPTFS